MGDTTHIIMYANHVNLGSGFPVTVHSNSTVSSSTASRLLSGTVKLGATWRSEIEV